MAEVVVESVACLVLMRSKLDFLTHASFVLTFDSIITALQYAPTDSHLPLKLPAALSLAPMQQQWN